LRGKGGCEEMVEVGRQEKLGANRIGKISFVEGGG